MIKLVSLKLPIKVIAAGGVIRIANSCVIKDGKLLDVNFLKILEQGQILEYIRAFYCEWLGVDLMVLLVISGAFGLFDKKSLLMLEDMIHTVGEDIKLS
jgi:hypothetical protein